MYLKDIVKKIRKKKNNNQKIQKPLFAFVCLFDTFEEAPRKYLQWLDMYRYQS